MSRSIDTYRVIPGFFDIVRSQNRGVAFGIFNDSTSEWRTTLLVIASVAAVVDGRASMLWNAQQAGPLLALGLRADSGRRGGQRLRPHRVGPGDGLPALLYRRLSMAHVQRGGLGDRDRQRAAAARSAAAETAGGECILRSSTSRFCTPTACWWRWHFWPACGWPARLGKQAGLNAEAVTNLGIYCALAAIAGAKLMMFMVDLPLLRGASAARSFRWSTLQAGGVFYGGLIAALGVAWWYMRKTKLPPLQTADVFAPGIALGHGIGRLGCFSAGCCWGVECHRPGR